MFGEINEVLKKPSYLGGSRLYTDANFNSYQSHAQEKLAHISALLSPLPGPKHPLFPPTHDTWEHLLTMMTSTCIC
jgi:hypothetical protein